MKREIKHAFCAIFIFQTRSRELLSNFIKRIDEIREKYRKVDAQCEDFVDLLISNNTFRIESPIYRNKTAYFLTGFETFELWKAIIQSFMYTGKYLWIYGALVNIFWTQNYKNYSVTA